MNTTFQQANTLDILKSKADIYLNQLDKELSKIDYINKLEKQTGLRKSYLAVGVTAVVLTMVLLDLGAKLVTNAIAWIYPAYASFKAIESPSTEDDTQWLTYWTVVGFAQMIEYFSDILLYWFPFYYTFKVVFILWLILPQFKGAHIAYVCVLRPFLLGAQPEIEQRKNKLSDTFNKIGQDLMK
ncbi:TB2/DP1, HVA22 family-domain-containing protein [Gilbertella persicaria]|uniref:TB2/DP1, HVA22 family-domain-containing protein n=1 Tax=Gilbertella persicaria TaxID=101096 RepID=UPI00221FB330|nr:TB2/DP1, HVA22 family-domain-containing protein [Gilbertella persicaria]KAI8085774.1 TB2/DP1, HVA22 family-domain-containing protein [Gilbertella persicaria]